MTNGATKTVGLGKGAVAIRTGERSFSLATEAGHVLLSLGLDEIRLVREEHHAAIKSLFEVAS